VTEEEDITLVVEDVAHLVWLKVYRVPSHHRAVADQLLAFGLAFFASPN
jgi:hypothetical protein